MYTPGIGHHLSEEEAEAYQDARENFEHAVRVGFRTTTTGDKQDRLTDLLKAIQPAFSEGEMKYVLTRMADGMVYL